MALGAGVLLLANVVLVPLHGTLVALTGASLGLQGLTAVAVFAAQYAMHSGLASVQIGFLRQLGYELPERYDHPFLARSPADFWRRWNTYVGAWVQRYLFAPLALHLARYKIASSAAAQATAVVLSFVVVGLMHDGYVYAVDRVVQPRATWILTVGGVMTLGWLAADRLGILSRASAWSGGRGAGWAVPLAGRAAFVATIILMIVAGRH
jgi:hypothetical protein